MSTNPTSDETSSEHEIAQRQDAATYLCEMLLSLRRIASGAELPQLATALGAAICEAFAARGPSAKSPPGEATEEAASGER
jgi:hypothetical protein